MLNTYKKKTVNKYIKLKISGLHKLRTLNSKQRHALDEILFRYGRYIDVDGDEKFFLHPLAKADLAKTINTTIPTLNNILSVLVKIGALDRLERSVFKINDDILVK